MCSEYGGYDGGELNSLMNFWDAQGNVEKVVLGLTIRLLLTKDYPIELGMSNS